MSVGKQKTSTKPKQTIHKLTTMETLKKHYPDASRDRLILHFNIRNFYMAWKKKDTNIRLLSSRRLFLFTQVHHCRRHRGQV